MNRIVCIICIAFLALLLSPAQAQEKNSAAKVEMADVMRADGKIYVVVAIITIVLAGIFIYLFLLDRKLKKLENLLKEKHTPN
jgi:CcmD family protein